MIFLREYLLEYPFFWIVFVVNVLNWILFRIRIRHLSLPLDVPSTDIGSTSGAPRIDKKAKSKGKSPAPEILNF